MTRLQPEECGGDSAPRPAPCTPNSDGRQVPARTRRKVPAQCRRERGMVQRKLPGRFGTEPARGRRPASGRLREGNGAWVSSHQPVFVTASLTPPGTDAPERPATGAAWRDVAEAHSGGRRARGRGSSRLLLVAVSAINPNSMFTMKNIS